MTKTLPYDSELQLKILHNTDPKEIFLESSPKVAGDTRKRIHQNF